MPHFPSPLASRKKIDILDKHYSKTVASLVSPSFESIHPTVMSLHGTSTGLLHGLFKKKRQNSGLQEMYKSTFFLPACFHPKILLTIENVLGRCTWPQIALKLAEQNLCFSWKKSAGSLYQYKPFT